jgi:hypothetical protein
MIMIRPAPKPIKGGAWIPTDGRSQNRVRAGMVFRFASLALPPDARNDDAMSEKRSSPREQSFLKAQAICSGQTSIECLVSDISATGARLQTMDGVVASMLPDVFELLLVRSGEQRAVRVAWRNETELGVAFQ